MNIKIINEDTDEIIFTGDVKRKGQTFILPNRINLPTNYIVEVEGQWIVKSLAINALADLVSMPPPPPNYFILKDCNHWNDLEVCPCCFSKDLDEMIDYDYCENMFPYGKKCDNCGWDTSLQRCYHSKYLENLIKK